MSSYISRINQIDADQLDNEIFKVLRSEIKEIAAYTAPGRIDKWQAEVDALLKLLIWRYSLYGDTCTFGQRLLNLHYVNLTRSKAVLYLILSVLPQYVRDKLANENFSTRDTIARRSRALVDNISNAIELVGVINLFIFLHRGVQSRLIEVLLGLSTQSMRTYRPRNIGYSYMTRELLWHGLMELFATGVLVTNFHYLKHTLMRLWRFRMTRKPNEQSVPLMDPSTKCAYCDDIPILPSHAGCTHIFCYYCLRAHFTAMDKFLCPKCNTELCAKDMKSYAVANAEKGDEALIRKDANVDVRGRT